MSSHDILERLIQTVARLAERVRHLEVVEIVAANLPAHTHAGAGQGGTVAHSATTGQGVNDHHNKSHAHTVADGSGAIATDQAVDIQSSLRVDSIVNDTGLAAGTYTPSLTNVANLDGSTVYVCQYLRVGNVVTVSGRVDVNPTTTATSTQLGISLPIAVGDFTASNQLGGVASSLTSPGEVAGIYADTVNERAQMQWITSDTANHAMLFTFTYLVV